MSNFLSVIVRSETRLRLNFDVNVSSSAFTGTGTIVVTNLDGVGVNPTVRGRIPVVGSPISLEIALAPELVDGALYQVSVTGIPTTDSTTATGTLQFTTGQQFNPINTEFSNPNVEAALYGVDLVWTGTDYLETPDGDLATVSGKANLDGALRRRLGSDSLTWDDNYGVKSRQFVDAPNASAPALRGLVLRQMLLDNRVASATVSIVIPIDNQFEADLQVDVVPVGSSNASDISISFNSPF